jgi:hypothetical protein
VRSARPCRRQALALEFRCGLAGERGQPAQQLVQEVKVALLALGERRVSAERGSDGFSGLRCPLSCQAGCRGAVGEHPGSQGA